MQYSDNPVSIWYRKVFLFMKFYVDASYKMNDKDLLIPEKLRNIQKQFENVYFSKYNSRVIQFLYEESQYTLAYVSIIQWIEV